MADVGQMDSDQQGKVRTVATLTHVSERVATMALQSNNWDVQKTVTQFYEQKEKTQRNPFPSAPPASAQGSHAQYSSAPPSSAASTRPPSPSAPRLREFDRPILCRSNAELAQVSKITPFQIEVFRKSFNVADTENKGFISRTEVKKMWRFLMGDDPIDRWKLPALFAIYDWDHKNLMTFDEFVLGAGSLRHESKAWIEVGLPQAWFVPYKAMFVRFDKQHSGLIDLVLLRKFFGMGAEVSEKKMQGYMKRCDIGGRKSNFERLTNIMSQLHKKGRLPEPPQMGPPPRAKQQQPAPPAALVHPPASAPPQQQQHSQHYQQPQYHPQPAPMLPVAGMHAQQQQQQQLPGLTPRQHQAVRDKLAQIQQTQPGMTQRQMEILEQQLARQLQQQLQSRQQQQMPVVVQPQSGQPLSERERFMQDQLQTAQRHAQQAQQQQQQKYIEQQAREQALLIRMQEQQRQQQHVLINQARAAAAHQAAFEAQRQWQWQQQQQAMQQQAQQQYAQRSTFYVAPGPYPSGALPQYPYAQPQYPQQQQQQQQQQQYPPPPMANFQRAPLPPTLHSVRSVKTDWRRAVTGSQAPPFPPPLPQPLPQH
eukprot:TRINITY_DN1759_c0_g8_i1.p1 TRINITY_DN1759_c0_g8~~TRINITY_DN1759_c0_g8_i1.p1  ORF type:complete len:605 (-),score=163.19 TRINITY_DN1759_c0_g8_i1:264-2042(-)